MFLLCSCGTAVWAVCCRSALPYGVLQHGCIAASSPLLPGPGQLAAVWIRRRRSFFGGRAAAGFIVKLG